MPGSRPGGGGAAPPDRRDPGLRRTSDGTEVVEIEDRNREVAGEQLELAQERYRLGAASFLELLEAQSSMADGRAGLSQRPLSLPRGPLGPGSCRGRAASSGNRLFPITHRLARVLPWTSSESRNPRETSGSFRRRSALSFSFSSPGVCSSLKPAAPSVDRATVWTDTVQFGTMVRAVRGNGTLVPEEMRWITAVTAGRIEQRYLLPGATIDSTTVILRLSNPDVEVQLLQSQQQLSQAETQLITLRSQLETQRLTQEGMVAQTRTQSLDANRVYDQNQRLFERNPDLVAKAELERSQELARGVGDPPGPGERERLEVLATSVEEQIEAQQEQIERLRAIVQFNTDAPGLPGGDGRGVRRTGRAPGAGRGVGPGRRKPRPGGSTGASEGRGPDSPDPGPGHRRWASGPTSTPETTRSWAR